MCEEKGQEPRQPPQSSESIDRWLRALGKALARTLRQPEPPETPAGADLPVEPDDLREDLHATAEKMFRSLSIREELVLRMRFGVGGHSARTMKEVADSFSVSRSRIGQIKSRALRQLCNKLYPDEVREFLHKLGRLPQT